MLRLTSLSIFTLFLLAKVSTSQAQYWQQQVDYNINVKLDDSLHILSGDETIIYHNFSPEPLSELYFHFWANAYSNKGTPLFRQLAEDKELRARFASPDEMGYMKNLAFTCNGQPLTLEFDDEFKEIGKVTLSEPLKPGDSVVIHTPFEVKLPGDLSRGGHIGNDYNVTQWFPKAALYDKDGWHTMPYLNWGEYYDEFGSYDVSISVPRNYVVAATGNLQTETEIAWMEERVAQSTRAIKENDFSFIKNHRAKLYKTVRFTETNIHDFAWFASREFLVQKQSFMLNDSSHEVTGWAFFPSSAVTAWKKATDYLKSSTLHYSDEVGAYPYQTVKAVHGALRAGGGMEYPTITVISPGTASVLHTVVLHEVGHNWFQGMLGTNERRYPFMDEAINSFYENMFFNEKHTEGVNAQVGGFQDQLSEYVIKHTALRHESQPNNLHSCQYTQLNYGMVVYSKAAYAFNYLEDYLGKELFSECMKQFFNEWHFKHPQPADLRKTFEDVSQRSLSWFFDDMIGSDAPLDYAITDVNEYEIVVTNEGGIPAPFKITVRNEGIKIHEKWYSGFADQETLTLPKLPYDEIAINDGVYPYEINLRNNHFIHGKTGTPAKLRFGLAINNDSRKSSALLPIVGANSADGLMLGLLFYKAFIPQTKLELQLAPMYGTRSGNLTGTGRIRYNVFWKKEYHHRLRFGIGASQFSQNIRYVSDDSQLQTEVLENLRVEPFVSWKFRKLPLRNTRSNEIRTSYIYRSQPLGIGTSAIAKNYSTVQLTHIYEDTYPLFNYSLTSQLQVGNQFSRAQVVWKGSIPYSSKKNIRFRLFGGYQFSPSTDNQIKALFDYSLSGSYGAYDPMMDGYLLDRSRDNAFWSRQIMTNFGGFATANRRFTSNSFLIAANIDGPLPIITPKWMRLFANAGYLPNQGGVKNNLFVWEAGLSFVLWKDAIEIYVPMLYSPEFIDFLDLNNRKPFAPDAPFNFTKNITFKFNLQKMNPFDLVDHARLVGG